jgi:hypothetical protein
MATLKDPNIKQRNTNRVIRFQYQRSTLFGTKSLGSFKVTFFVPLFHFIISKKLLDQEVKNETNN